MYRVIKTFADIQDANHVYLPGDNFPREGMEVTAERLTELSTDKNLRGKPLIVEVEEAVEEVNVKPKSTRKRVKKDDD